MKTSEAVNFFGTKYNMAKQLGISFPTIYKIGEYPNLETQAKIEYISKGKLRACLNGEKIRLQELREKIKQQALELEAEQEKKD